MIKNKTFLWQCLRKEWVDSAVDLMKEPQKYVV